MLSSAVNRARSGRRQDSGFTLIELLIVIVILGILAAIVVFSVNGITDKGDTAACKSTVAEIDTAYEAAVAQGTATDTSATVASLSAFFHGGNAPAKAGTHTIGATTTVAQADAFCP